MIPETPKRIFLSYASPDRLRAEAVRTLLQLGGAHVFMASRSIAPGLEWKTALRTALLTADAMCILWSHDASASSWVRLEYQFFLGAYPDRACIPLIIDETPLPDQLTERQAAHEFAALANEFLVLRRELADKGLNHAQISRIVRERLKQRGLRVDSWQERRVALLLGTGAATGALVHAVAQRLSALVEAIRPFLRSGKTGWALALLSAVSVLLAVLEHSADRKTEDSVDPAQKRGGEPADAGRDADGGLPRSMEPGPSVASAPRDDRTYVVLAKPRTRIAFMGRDELASVERILRTHIQKMPNVSLAPNDGDSAIIASKHPRAFYIESVITAREPTKDGDRFQLSLIVETYAGRDMRALIQGSVVVSAAGDVEVADSPDAAFKPAFDQLADALAPR